MLLLARLFLQHHIDADCKQSCRLMFNARLLTPDVKLWGGGSGVQIKGEQALCDIQPNYSQNTDKHLDNGRLPQCGW